MKVLQLVVTAQWYNMIEQGIKKEEYREVKPYWIKRLCDWWSSVDDKNVFHVNGYKKFDAVKFLYGYTDRSMIFECKGIKIDNGSESWGAPKDKKVFIIKLGNRIE